MYGVRGMRRDCSEVHDILEALIRLQSDTFSGVPLL
jgi:hypothetical protein